MSIKDEMAADAAEILAEIGEPVRCNGRTFSALVSDPAIGEDLGLGGFFRDRGLHDQAWIAEAPVGDWFYAPGFTYDSGMMILYIVEAAARDGNACVCVSLLPDGSLDGGSVKMLKGVGEWMRANGEGIYGSKAWVKPGEGEMVDGRLKMLPGGKLERRHADFKFGPQDFRFTVGKDGALCAFCLTVPAPGTELRITSLGSAANQLGKPVKSVSMLGRKGAALKWRQQPDALVITCPDTKPFATAIGFRIK